MLKNKYSVSFLNSKWEVLKRNVNIFILPRRDELIFFSDKYYIVLNVVHTINDSHDIFIIVDEYKKNKEIESTDNQAIVNLLKK